MRHVTFALLLTAASAVAGAQEAKLSPAPVTFDVVSIKRSAPNASGSGGRTFPDGSQRMVNQPLRNFILTASPVATREVIGLPEWATTERYDVEVKPPAGATREQIREMWRTMWADRMKLVAHVEQRERDVYSLVVARSDGRLGPELKPSTLDCSPPPQGTPPPAAQAPPAGPSDMLSRCGMMMGIGRVVSGSMRLDGLASSLYGLVGGEVENHTGLDGFYSVNLTFGASRGAAAPLDSNAAGDDAPDIFTAVQEQLGLKLQREKKMMPVFVVDHIERPTEN